MSASVSQKDREDTWNEDIIYKAHKSRRSCLCVVVVRLSLSNLACVHRDSSCAVASTSVPRWEDSPYTRTYSNPQHAGRHTHISVGRYIYLTLLACVSLVREQKAHLTLSLTDALPYQSLICAQDMHSRAHVFKKNVVVIDGK